MLATYCAYRCRVAIGVDQLLKWLEFTTLLRAQAELTPFLEELRALTTLPILTQQAGYLDRSAFMLRSAKCAVSLLRQLAALRRPSGDATPRYTAFRNAALVR